MVDLCLMLRLGSVRFGVEVGFDLDSGLDSGLGLRLDLGLVSRQGRLWNQGRRRVLSHVLGLGLGVRVGTTLELGSTFFSRSYIAIGS